MRISCLCAYLLLAVSPAVWADLPLTVLEDPHCLSTTTQDKLTGHRLLTPAFTELELVVPRDFSQTEAGLDIYLILASLGSSGIERSQERPLVYEA